MMMPDQLIPLDVTFLAEACKLLIINGERGRNRIRAVTYIQQYTEQQTAL